MKPKRSVSMDEKMWAFLDLKNMQRMEPGVSAIVQEVVLDYLTKTDPEWEAKAKQWLLDHPPKAKTSKPKKAAQLKVAKQSSTKQREKAA